jgi:acyl phosphate:glycerol-3-phosphate acyltransferase
VPGWALVAVGYLLGSIPTGVLVARRHGVDLRTVGSGNIGATNVARALGKRTGVFVLVFDALKGLGAVLLAIGFGASDPWLVAVGYAAVLGHVFPVWLKLHGGKGVATSVGVLLGILPVAGAAAAVAYLVVYGKTRTSSLGSLTGATAALLAAPFVATSLPRLSLAAMVFVTIVVTHRENIRRLLRGEEGRV